MLGSNVAAGFLIIFPEAFPEKLLTQFDPSRTTVEWYDFMQCLLKFYHSHFHQGKKYSHIQKLSVFSKCNRLALLSRESLFDKNTILPFRDTVRFDLADLRKDRNSSDAVTHHIKAPAWIRDEKDQSLYRMLKFFIPRIHLGVQRAQRCASR